MYPSALGTSFIIQHVARGTGYFSGSDHGRARVTITNADPNATVRAAARLYGPLANALTLEFIDRGTGVAVPATVVEVVGTAVKVTLRRLSTGSVLATGQEVAQAINAQERCPIRAVPNGDGTGVVAAVAATALTGGVASWGTPTADAWSSGTTYSLHQDVVRYGVCYRAIQGPNLNHPPESSPSWWEVMPVGRKGTYVWQPNNTQLGFFSPENDDTIVLRQFEARFTIASGTHTCTLWRAPMNDVFEPVVNEAVAVFIFDALTTSAPDVCLSDVRIMLPAGWCFYVTTDVHLAGIVRMDLRREAHFPYL